MAPFQWLCTVAAFYWQFFSGICSMAVVTIRNRNALLDILRSPPVLKDLAVSHGGREPKSHGMKM